MNKYALVILCLLISVPGRAQTLTFQGGTVTGATGVVVGGDVVDLEFVDGDCISVYSGCNSQAVFLPVTPSNF